MDDHEEDDVMLLRAGIRSGTGGDADHFGTTFMNPGSLRIDAGANTTKTLEKAE